MKVGSPHYSKKNDLWDFSIHRFDYYASTMMRTTYYFSWSFFSMNFIFFLVERRPPDLFIREQKAIFSLVERGLISVLQQRRHRQDSIINLKLCQDLDKKIVYQIIYWFIVFEVLVKVNIQIVNYIIIVIFNLSALKSNLVL